MPEPGGFGGDGGGPSEGGGAGAADGARDAHGSQKAMGNANVGNPSGKGGNPNSIANTKGSISTKAPETVPAADIDLSETIGHLPPTAEDRLAARQTALRVSDADVDDSESGPSGTPFGKDVGEHQKDLADFGNKAKSMSHRNNIGKAANEGTIAETTMRAKIAMANMSVPEKIFSAIAPFPLGLVPLGSRMMQDDPGQTPKSTTSKGPSTNEGGGGRAQTYTSSPQPRTKSATASSTNNVTLAVDYSNFSNPDNLTGQDLRRSRRKYATAQRNA